jgi:hypothetical protein
MRTVGGILLGILLFYPGIELLRWILVGVLGFYDAMTLTDGCLLMIMILLSVHLVRNRQRPAVRSRRPGREQEQFDEPHLQYLPGNEPRHPSRRQSSRGRRSTRRSQ